MLGVSTGGRISELLSLTIGDVYQNKKPVTDLLYNKSIVKGGEVSRAVPVNVDGRDAIDALIDWHREKYAPLAPTRPLFPSRNKRGTVAMNRQTAHEMLKAAFMTAGLNGKLATHSLRKSFAQRVYEQSSDIYLVQELLGHRSVATTQKYLGVNYADARAAVEGIALGKVDTDASDTPIPTFAEPYRMCLLSNWARQHTCESLRPRIADNRSNPPNCNYSPPQRKPQYCLPSCPCKSHTPWDSSQKQRQVPSLMKSESSLRHSWH